MARENTFILHAGAKEFTVDDLHGVETPEATDTHFPIAHHLLRNLVVRTLEERGLTIRKERVALTPDGNRYFGLIELAPGDLCDLPPELLNLSGGWNYAVGLRNAHDKSFSASTVGGSGLFVCDNLAFSGEVKIARKHTRYIMRDLPGRVETGISKVLGDCNRLAQSYGRYVEYELCDSEVDSTLMTLVRERALPPSKLLKVIGEYDNPSHEEHGKGTAWTLFNAITEQFRGANPERTMGRTITLHRELDKLVAAA